MPEVSEAVLNSHDENNNKGKSESHTGAEHRSQAETLTWWPIEKVGL
jgi:hypothetical protein